MDRKSITVVVVVILCAVGLAYSQGWFGPSSVSSDTENDKVTTNQTVDQEKTNADSVRVTEEKAALPIRPRSKQRTGTMNVSR